jgi:hypothetical protein
MWEAGHWARSDNGLADEISWASQPLTRYVITVLLSPHSLCNYYYYSEESRHREEPGRCSNRRWPCGDGVVGEEGCAGGRAPGGAGRERREARGGRCWPLDVAARVPAHTDGRQGTQAWLRRRWVIQNPTSCLLAWSLSHSTIMKGR